MPNSYVKRDKRKSMIVEKLEQMAKDGNTPEATAYKLARLMDIAVNYNLYSVLAEMVTDGKLTVRDEEIVNRCTRTFYGLPEGTFTIDRSREIVINGKLWAVQKGF